MKNRKYQVITGILLFVVLLFIYQSKNLNKNSETNNKNSETNNKNSVEVKENVETKKSTADPELKNSEKETPIVQTQSKVTKDITAQINKVIKTYYTNTMSAENQEEIVQSSDAEKREVIESYQDIHTYIKPGLSADTYVVFTTYNIKLFNISTLVPGMSVLTVSKDKKEVFQINEENINEEQKAYIDQLSNYKDIKKIIQEVNSKLTNAIKKDASLKVFVDYMKKVS